jgi:hypothetical protein
MGIRCAGFEGTPVSPIDANVLNIRVELLQRLNTLEELLVVKAFVLVV